MPNRRGASDCAQLRQHTARILREISIGCRWNTSWFKRKLAETRSPLTCKKTRSRSCDLYTNTFCFFLKNRRKSSAFDFKSLKERAPVFVFLMGNEEEVGCISLMGGASLSCQSGPAPRWVLSGNQISKRVSKTCKCASCVRIRSRRGVIVFVSDGDSPPHQTHLPESRRAALSERIRAGLADVLCTNNTRQARQGKARLTALLCSTRRRVMTSRTWRVRALQYRLRTSQTVSSSLEQTDLPWNPFQHNKIGPLTCLRHTSIW